MIQAGIRYLKQCGTCMAMEARAGIEPAIVVLQTTALPLGDLAVRCTAKGILQEVSLGVSGGLSTVKGSWNYP